MDMAEKWPALLKNDDALLDELHKLLTDRVQGDAYSSDGSFATNLALLPKGLRAMAATHWLDVSLTLDSITWHFGNFGEPGLVAETEAGLLELSLDELANVFREARDLMVPLLNQRTTDGQDPYEVLASHGLRERGNEIDGRAWDLCNPTFGKETIYDAWVRYVRNRPEDVFGT